MKLSQEAARQTVIDQFEFVQTCYLARRLCMITRNSRAVLNPQDAQKFCFTVSKLCKEAGCNKPSKLCLKAIAALEEKNEKEYMDICKQSCKACGEVNKKPDNTIFEKKSNSLTYVA